MIRDHYRDKRLGIETSEDTVCQDKSLYKDMNVCIPIPYDKMDWLIKLIEMKRDDVFIDLGCGKGRAVLLAAMGRLKKAIGVDIDEKLIAIAEENLRSDSLKLNTPVEFINADIASYDMDSGTIFFMYNPCGHSTTAKSVANIRASLFANPRKIRIVCLSPGYRYLLDEADWLEIDTEMDKEDLVIWRNKTS